MKTDKKLIFGGLFILGGLVLWQVNSKKGIITPILDGKK